MVCLVGTNHKQSVAESRICGESPVVLRDLRRGVIRQHVVVNPPDHFRVGVNGVLLQEAHEAMGSAWGEDEHEGEERNKGDLRDSDEKPLHQGEVHVGTDSKKMHPFIFCFVNEWLDPGVRL